MSTDELEKWTVSGKLNFGLLPALEIPGGAIIEQRYVSCYCCWFTPLCHARETGSEWAATVPFVLGLAFAWFRHSMGPPLS